MYTGALSNAPLYLKAAYQFGGELASNGEPFRSPNRDEKNDIAEYWKSGAGWDDLPSEDQIAAVSAWRNGYNAEAAQIDLHDVSPDAPENIARVEAERVVWRWRCPGPHAHPRSVVACAKERATQDEIISDPYCYSCRKDAAMAGLNE